MSEQKLNGCVLIPAYNPPAVFIEIVDALNNQGFEVIVVNDGSSAEYEHIFSTISDNNENIVILDHDQNQGKGSALKTGFNYFLTNFKDQYSGIVTADADGQHAIEDIQKICIAGESRVEDFILGVRQFDGNVPLRSSLGNRLTKSLFRLFYGVKLQDTQTGLRYYPSSFLHDLIKLDSSGYEFEFSALIAANKLGSNILQIPIATHYEEGNPTSHFRPVQDSLRIYYQFVKFSLSSIIGFAVDICLFSILFFLSSNIWFSTLFARVISGAVNFFINDQIVFTGNFQQGWKMHAIKYAVVWLLLIFLSASLVTLLVGDTNYVVVIKIMVDVLLFLISFYLQKKYVFT